MRTQTHWEIFKSALVVSIGKAIVYFIEKLVFLCFTLKSSYCGNFATPRKIVDASVLRLFARTVLAKTSMAGPTFSTATESNQAPVLKLYRCNCIYPLFVGVQNDKHKRFKESVGNYCLSKFHNKQQMTYFLHGLFNILSLPLYF